MTTAAGEMRILVADDENALRRIVVSVLRRDGYDVVEARNVADALAAAGDAARVDLLVTDLLMPDGNGWQLGKTLRRQRPGLKVICISGNPADLDGPDGDDAPPLFLQKPFTIDALKALVSQALAS